MKILVVEDDPKIGALVKAGLENEGFATDWLTDGESAQKRIELHHMDYDVIILDLMLPKRDGFEICKNVRDKGIKTPILILTAKSFTDDKIAALDRGADDYLVKPFDLKELLARIRALLRRPKTNLPSELKVKNVILNSVAQKVTVNNKEIKLTLKEFRLLEYLMRRPNQVVNREDILSNLWDFDFSSFSNVVDVHINSLRKKINAVNHGEGFIETVRGVGYKINS